MNSDYGADRWVTGADIALPASNAVNDMFGGVQIIKDQFTASNDLYSPDDYVELGI